MSIKLSLSILGVYLYIRATYLYMRATVHTRGVYIRVGNSYDFGAASLAVAGAVAGRSRYFRQKIQ